jgi:hypothetical protein
MRGVERGQVNKKTPSNQQNLIGKMETNGQQKLARSEEALLAMDTGRKALVIEQRRKECRKRLSKRIANRRTRGEDERALDALATRKRMIWKARTFAAIRSMVAWFIRRRNRPRRERAVLAVAVVRVMPTAAHDQVNRKH